MNDIKILDLEINGKAVREVEDSYTTVRKFVGRVERGNIINGKIKWYIPSHNVIKVITVEDYRVFYTVIGVELEEIEKSHPIDITKMRMDMDEDGLIECAVSEMVREFEFHNNYNKEV